MISINRTFLDPAQPFTTAGDELDHLQQTDQIDRSSSVQAVDRFHRIANSLFSPSRFMLDRFKTAVPFWGQTSECLSNQDSQLLLTSTASEKLRASRV